MYDIWEGKDARTAGAPLQSGSAKESTRAEPTDGHPTGHRAQWMDGPLGTGSGMEGLLRQKRAESADTSPSDCEDSVDAIAGRFDGEDGECSGRTVHLAIYEHRYGLDISAHDTQASAHAALVDIARGQCARDPAIREAVCARYGTWPAGDMTEAELERLLGEWNDIAPSEALWIAECAVESEALRARRRAFMTPPE